MNKDKVSVIVPVFNTEQYLPRCLDSILDQTYDALEIILVDDGSNDASPSICDRYAEKDSRIKVLHQTNQGPSAARNAGINLASSDYIQFADSDDLIHPQMTEILLNVMKQSGADIVQCGIHHFKDSPPTKDTVDPPATKRLLVTEEQKYEWLIKNHLETVIVMNKIYKSDIFSDLRFVVRKYCEDEFLIHHALKTAKTFAVIDEPLYYYFHNPKGIIRQMTPEKRLHGIEGYLDRLRFFSEEGYISFAISTYMVLIGMFRILEHELGDSHYDSISQDINECNTEYYIKQLNKLKADAEQISDTYFPWKNNL